MSHPILFRHGDLDSASYDNLQKDLDILVEGGQVGPDSGGVSAFSQRAADWVAEETWALQDSTILVDGLSAKHTYGNHWLIAPARTMTLVEYKGLLQELNSSSVRLDRIPETALTEENLSTWSPYELTDKFQHPRQRTRQAHYALVTLLRQRIPVPGWKDNDYAYLACIANALRQGSLELSTLIGSESGTQQTWSRESAFTKCAVAAYMDVLMTQAQAFDDDYDGDEQSDLLNDYTIIGSVFNFDMPHE
ncbi:hypothetical protein C8Q70DRAFT_917645 [Cubamyces menziesii]|nr:hypothetical protein C8Q70DRAFT_917645 [Cubamyces menziesii]